jgi:hypothetical protein
VNGFLAQFLFYLPIATTGGYDRGHMKWRKRIALGVVAATLALPGAAHAASAPEPDPNHDARTEGFEGPVQLEGATGMLWLLFLFLSVVSMSALFKDSKRARTE